MLNRVSDDELRLLHDVTGRFQMQSSPSCWLVGGAKPSRLTQMVFLSRTDEQPQLNSLHEQIESVYI